MRPNDFLILTSLPTPYILHIPVEHKTVHSFLQIQCSRLWYLFQHLHLWCWLSHQRLVHYFFIDFQTVHHLFSQAMGLLALSFPVMLAPVAALS